MQGELQRLTINRSSKKELDVAIKDLEKRGYELLNTYDLTEHRRDFDYQEKRFGTSNVFRGVPEYKKYRAVMQRMYYRKTS